MDGEVDSMTPSKALMLGLLLSAVVPKNLLLALSAGVIVGEARLSVGEASVVIVGFTVIATSTVAIPVVAHLVAPARMRGPFQRLREWLVENKCDDHGSPSAHDRSCHDRQWHREPLSGNDSRSATTLKARAGARVMSTITS
jgi:hypothetical protein